MKYTYIIIKDGYQGKGDTTLVHMGEVESESVPMALVAVQNAFPEWCQDGSHHVYLTLPKAELGAPGAVVT